MTKNVKIDEASSRSAASAVRPLQYHDLSPVLAMQSHGPQESASFLQPPSSKRVPVEISRWKHLSQHDFELPGHMAEYRIIQPPRKKCPKMVWLENEIRIKSSGWLTVHDDCGHMLSSRVLPYTSRAMQRHGKCPTAVCPDKIVSYKMLCFQ